MENGLGFWLTPLQQGLSVIAAQNAKTGFDFALPVDREAYATKPNRIAKFEAESFSLKQVYKMSLKK